MDWRRLDHDEEGATLVIVVLSLVALFGMLVLVVDVGGLLFRRREMVNVSDAAALSAAKSCILADSFTPEEAADEWARSNSDSADVGPVNITQITPDCADLTGFVSVRYGAAQELFFAPVLGFGDTGNVVTEATAVWGPPGGANPVPLTIYTSSFLSDCDVENVPVDTSCYFWFDNNGFGTSRFGLLDLREWDGSNQSGWDVPSDTQSCGQGVGAGTFGDWISGAGSLSVDVNYPAPTYVCIQEGIPEVQVWQSLEGREGDILTFPINRCDLTLPGVVGGQVDRDGNEVTCSTAPHKYDIIGFVDLYLERVLQSSAEWGGTPVTLCRQNNFNVTQNTTYSLLSLSGGQCPSSAPSGIVDLLMDGKAPGDPTAQYTFNPVTNSVTWRGPDGRVPLEFSWWVDGECGPPPGNSSAACIKVRTVEVRIGGSSPGGGTPISNLRAYKLCDEDISGSCDPIQVP